MKEYEKYYEIIFSKIFDFSYVIIMINNLIKLSKISIFLNYPSFHFCSKADILKTYLEIIPPHKIY